MDRKGEEQKERRAHYEEERTVCMCVGCSVSSQLFWNGRFNREAMSRSPSDGEGVGGTG